MALESGVLLYNRYRIVEILGQGGMGSIYRAIDENLGVEVAVKENLFTTDEYARQFRQEAVILAGLRHPNLPRVSDHFVIDEEGQYLIMDYIRGDDLRDRMERNLVIQEIDMLDISIAICDALIYMHSRMPPILHRDIKPSNVRISIEGDIYLVDFGLAKVVYQGQQTSTGAQAMTPGYSPPEQYGAARTDQRSDIYSLGATMYAALTGSIPEDSLARTMDQVVLTPVRKRNHIITLKTANAIEKALAVHPKDRFQTAQELKNELVLARTAVQPKGAEEGLISVDSEMRVGGLQPVYGTDTLETNEIPSVEIGEAQPQGINQFLESAAQSSPGGISWKKGRDFAIAVLVGLILIAVAFGIVFLLEPSLPKQMYDDASALMVSFFSKEATKPLISYSSSIATVDDKNIANSYMSGDIDETLLPTNPLPGVYLETQFATLTPSSKPINYPYEATENTPAPTRAGKVVPTPLGGGSGQIAFASTRTGLPQIWIMNIDGTGLRQVTKVPTGACQPDWSPDGTQLVFISPCNENWETYVGSALFIIDADGSNMISFPIQGTGNFDPAWSPDGEKIIFTALKESERPQIWMRDLKTNKLQLLSEANYRDYQPSWSPDGAKIIFVSTRQGPFQVWIMNPDGTEQERFTVSGDLKNTNPVLSPNGQLLIFTQSEGFGSVPRLKGAKYPDGAAQEFFIFTRYGYPMRDADFSPDGFWVVFESWPEGVIHDVYIMSTNGAELTQLTSNPALDFDPVWRPITP